MQRLTGRLGLMLIATSLLHGQRRLARLGGHSHTIETLKHPSLGKTSRLGIVKCSLGTTIISQGGPIIFTMDREGRRDETLFTPKDGPQIIIYNVAAYSDGEIAVVGSSSSGDRITAFLARIAPDRKRQTIIHTWPYHPTVVTFAPDGSLWTIGNLKNEENTRDVVPGHLLRRFDRSGRSLGSTTIRVSGFVPDEISFLRASRDRVGWFTGKEYIEFSLDGPEIARYAAPEGAEARDITGMALSDDDDVVLSRFGGGKAEFTTLDRQNHTWMPASLSKEDTPVWARVLGFDGTTLVATTSNGRLARYNTKVRAGVP